MRDDSGRWYPAQDRRYPLGSALGAYTACIAMACAVGFLFDRAGALRTGVMLAAGSAMLLGMRDFRIFAALTVFLLPFLPTAFLAQHAAGLSGQKVVGAAVMLTAVSLFVTLAMRPGQVRFPAGPPVFIVYMAVFVLAAFNGARSTGSIPEYFRSLGVFRETSPEAYLQVILLAPMLVVVVAAVMALLVANSRRAGWILVPVFASALLLAAAVCVQAAGATATVADLAQQEARRTLSALGLHANEIGLLLNMALVQVMCALGEAGSGRARLVLGAVALMLIAGVLTTFSRGAFVGLAVGTAYVLAVARRGAWPVLLLLGIALLVAPLADALVERAMHGLGGNDMDAISSGRVDQIWRPLLPELARHPVFGSGHASILWSDAAQSRAILPVGHPHSAYLALLLDVGIVGTLVTGMFFVHAWMLFRRCARSLSPQPLRGFFQGGAACILLLLVQGITDDNFMPGFTHAYFWLAYGAAVGLGTRQPRESRRVRQRLLSVMRQGKECA